MSGSSRPSDGLVAYVILIHAVGRLCCRKKTRMRHLSSLVRNTREPESRPVQNWRCLDDEQQMDKVIRQIWNINWKSCRTSYQRLIHKLQFQDSTTSFVVAAVLVYLIPRVFGRPNSEYTNFSPLVHVRCCTAQCQSNDNNWRREKLINRESIERIVIFQRAVMNIELRKHSIHLLDIIFHEYNTLESKKLRVKPSKREHTRVEIRHRSIKKNNFQVHGGNFKLRNCVSPSTPTRRTRTRSH